MRKNFFKEIKTSSSKIPGHAQGGIVVLLMGLLFYMAWTQFKDTLTQGSRPSPSILKFKQIKKNGAPDFNVRDIHGNKFSLSQLQNKIVILNFWASWCEPCVDEFPSMLQLVEHFQGQVILIAVSADETLEDMKSFLRAFQVASPHIKLVWDKDKKLARQYGTEVLPESYILGKDLRLIRKIMGVDRWYTPEALKFFEKLIEENTSHK